MHKDKIFLFGERGGGLERGERLTYKNSFVAFNYNTAWKKYIEFIFV